MAKLLLNNFAGVAPRIPARALPNNMAQTANNVDLRDGQVRPLRGGLFTFTPTKPGTIQSIYLFASLYWFHWTQDVDVVPTPIAGDTSERTYFTGVDYPRATDSVLALTGGGTDYPINSYRLGLPAPAAAPGITLGAGGGCAAEDEISATFYTTYVSAWGEEGPPSAASAVFDICPGQTVTIALPAAPAGNYNVAGVNVYCAVSGFYQFVGSQVIGTANHVITAFNTASLGAENPSEGWVAPPDTMRGLTALPNGLIAGFDGNQVLFCEPYVPHAWPIAYRYSVNYPIVGIAAAGAALIVLTTGLPYIIMGVDPSAMSVSIIETLPQACVSKRSIVSLGGSVVYASPDGLVSINAGGQGQVVTERWMLRRHWQSYVPANIHGYYWEGAYVGFYAGGSFVFDPANEGLKFSDITATGGYNDLKNDALYVVSVGNIVQWNAGTDLTYTWKSKRFRAPKPFSPGALAVIADTYPATVNIYADGDLYDSVIAGSSHGIVLIGDLLIDEIEIEVTGPGIVDHIVLAESMSELREV